MLGLLAFLGGRLLCPELETFLLPIGVGGASFLVLVAQLAVSRRWRGCALGVLAAGSLVPLAQMLSDLGQMLSTVETMTLDHRAYLVDLTYGLNPVRVAQAVAHAPMTPLLKPLFVAVVDGVYASMMLMVGLTIILQIRQRSADWALTLAAFSIAGALGGLCYHVFPGTGPLTWPAFPQFPDPSTVSIAPSYADPSLVRNCMPSLHTTGALLVLMAARTLSRRFRIAAALFLAVTLVATMVKGHHYLIDLVVAVPFSVGVQALATSLMHRTRPGQGVILNGICVIGWLYVLVAHPEWFIGIPGLTLMATAASLALGIGSFLFDRLRPLPSASTETSALATC